MIMMFGVFAWLLLIFLGAHAVDTNAQKNVIEMKFFMVCIVKQKPYLDTA